MSIVKTISFDKELFEKIEIERIKRKDKAVSRTVNVLLEKLFEILDLKKESLMKSDCAVELHKGENLIYNYKGKAYNSTQGKKCSKCEIWKPFSEFYKDNRRKKEGEKFGYASQCKDCKK